MNMRQIVLALLASTALAAPVATMDSSVAGRHIRDHHQSRVDQHLGLYLFADGN
jgi:hypothetical protein